MRYPILSVKQIMIYCFEIIFKHPNFMYEIQINYTYFATEILIIICILMRIFAFCYFIHIFTELLLIETIIFRIIVCR